MGTSFRITDAAHKYGLDSSAGSQAVFAMQKAILGTTVSSSTTWVNNVAVVGQPGIISIQTSGGFTLKASLVYVDTTRGVMSSLQIIRSDTNELLHTISCAIDFTPDNLDAVGRDETLFAGADTILGNAYGNVLRGYAGNDRIDGGGGIDTAVFSGAAGRYQIQKNGTSASVSGPDGVDTLLAIERLQFDDKKIALDIDGSAGFAAELLGAILGRELMLLKKPLLGAVMDLFDQGYTLQTLAGAVMRLDIWDLLANGGQPGATNTLIANYLLTTVNKAAPSAAELADAVNALNTETGTAQGTFLWHLAESAANQTQVGLVGLAASGLDYL
jgi:hypothetical protein